MRRAAALGVLLALGSPARALAQPEPRVHTSLTWLVGDDDALHAPSEVRPTSPAPAVGDRPGYDDLASGLGSRFTGRENELVVGALAAARGFWPGVSTHAELSLGLDLEPLGSRPRALAVEDRGSALGLTFALGRSERAPKLSFRLFPLGADHLRVGWLELLAWGGEAGPHRDSPYAAARTPPRGAAAELVVGLLRAALAVKTATFLEPVPRGPAVEEASYGALALLELRTAAVAVGVAAGRFEHGRLEGLGASPRAVTTGASVRASVGVGLATPRVPFGLGLEPWAVASGSDQAASGWVVGVEAAMLVERLRSFDEPGRSVLEPARGAAVVGTLRAGPFEARGAVALREPSFVMRSVPGVFAGLTVPRGALSRTDVLGAASAAVRVRPWLEPGLSVGVRSPAAVMTASLDSLGQPTGATVVVYGPGDVDLLPPGEATVPVVEASASLGVQVSRLVGTTGFVGYRRDFNRTVLEPKLPSGAVARGFAEPNRLFYGLAARADW